MNNNNPLTEVALIILSVAILAAMTVLLVAGKINYIEALNFLIVVAGLFGVNVAAKAPSPSQQQQISDQQASLQQLIQQLTTTILPAVFQAHPVAAPTSAPQQPPQGGSVIAPVQPSVSASVPPTQFVPSPLAALQTSSMPAIVPPETK